jgi:hypothetical protein
MDKQEMIYEIMDNFDFEKVSKAMELLNWKWSGILRGGGADFVPTKVDLRKKARKFLFEVVNFDFKGSGGEKVYSVSSGGLKAIAFYGDEDSEIGLELNFVLESWGTSD